jgi:protein SCO1
VLHARVSLRCRTARARRFGRALVGSLSLACASLMSLGSAPRGAASFGPASAQAQTVVEDGVVTRKEAAPKRLSGIDVEEHLDRKLPLGLEFTDTSGQKVQLQRFVRGDRPVIFTLNYSDCPMLCSLQLSGLSNALIQLDERLGRDFDVVTVSLNPAETTERARETEARYRGEVAAKRPPEPGVTGQKPGLEAGGWHFLTGTPASIDALAEALGIRYGYNEARKEYVHPAVLVLSTPNGRISRYLYGIEYQKKTLGLSLIEAAEGKIGTSIDRLILYCFHYDDSEGKYAPVAMNIMRVGGSLTVIALGGFLGTYWFGHTRWSRRRRVLLGGLARGSVASERAASDPAALADGTASRTGDIGS